MILSKEQNSTLGKHNQLDNRLIHNLYSHFSDTLFQNSKLPCRTLRNIDYSFLGAKGSSIINSHDNRTVICQAGNFYSGPEGQISMSCGKLTVIKYLSTGSFSPVKFMCIIGCQASLGVRIINRGCPSKFAVAFCRLRSRNTLLSTRTRGITG